MSDGRKIYLKATSARSTGIMEPLWTAFFTASNTSTKIMTMLTFLEKEKNVNYRHETNIDNRLGDEHWSRYLPSSSHDPA